MIVGIKLQELMKYRKVRPIVHRIWDAQTWKPANNTFQSTIVPVVTDTRHKNLKFQTLQTTFHNIIGAF